MSTYKSLRKELRNLEDFSPVIRESISYTLSQLLHKLIETYELGVHDGYEDAKEDF